ncbi:MAG: NAD(P)-dependent oxidoreductase [Terriglobia bacterium]|nr:MAG: NAD(P)-dependent oxidoreductase [Terriglobia bacterium]
MRKIGILHPGQMGAAVALTAKNSGHEVYWASEGRSAETSERARKTGLQDAGTTARMSEICDTIVGVCPPEFAERMADEIGALSYRGLYVDLNAVSPERVRRIAGLVTANGAGFVDGCIIGQPPAGRGETWIYLCGERAVDAAGCFTEGPLEAEVIEGGIGQASALKMCFSAHAKGMAALRAAVLGAAHQLGVLEDLERQWSRSGPPMAQAVKSIEITAPKAWRFIAEMQEIVETFESVGMPGDFHRGAAEIYRRLAPFKGTEKPDLADALLRLTLDVSPELIAHRGK